MEKRYADFIPGGKFYLLEGLSDVLAPNPGRTCFIERLNQIYQYIAWSRFNADFITTTTLAIGRAYNLDDLYAALGHDTVMRIITDICEKYPLDETHEERQRKDRKHETRCKMDERKREKKMLLKRERLATRRAMLQQIPIFTNFTNFKENVL